MKHTGIKRFFSAAVAVVLAVGLMPLPAFAETGSGQQEETPLAAAGSAALASGPEMTAQSYYSDQKEITGLGTGAISNPKFANGGWNKVYFGSNEDSGEAPLLFNVLNTHETCFGGDTMFLDCTKVLMNMSSGNFRNEFFHPGNQINKYLNNEFLQQRFTSGEQGAIAYSVKGGHAPGDGWGWVTDNGGWNSPFCPIGWADHARIFILDAHEATNASYGFAKDKNSTYDTESPTRAKTGTDTEWWTRSQYQGFNSYSCVTILHDGKFSYEHHSREVGVSPCLNVKLSSILYTSQVDTNTYKLTVRDNNLKLNVGDARKDFPWVTVPFTITGDYNSLGLLLTDAEWTDSGWSNPDADFVYQNVQGTVKSWDESTNTTGGYCAFHRDVLDEHPDYNVYLIAELDSGYDNETDYASAPAKVTPKESIGRIANGYEGTYDGEPHGISVRVTWPGSGYTVKYGTTDGVYDLTTSPTITDVKDSPLTVYYQITADGFFTCTSSETVTILPANPPIPTGVSAYFGSTLESATLPDGWSWDSPSTDVGDLGTRTFSASYTSTSPNYKDMNGVAIPVTVKCSHNWGEASYEWSSDNSSVTAKHTCSVCSIDETETVSTSSAITKGPTCSAPGETTYTAEFRNKAFVSQTKMEPDVPIDHDAHGWDENSWIEVTPATCDEPGVLQRTCRYDKTHVETEWTEPLGHLWREPVIAKTGDNVWYATSYCERNNKHYVLYPCEDQTGKHDHSGAPVPGQEPKCTEAGLKEHYKCSCGALGWTQACADGLSKKDVVLKPTGHDWGEWQKTKLATCVKKGESVRVCANDPSHTETRVDSENPYAHAWGNDWELAKEPTCTNPGEEKCTCSECSATKTREAGAALGHDWGDATYEWAADNSYVTATLTCARNKNHVEIETATATIEVTKEPTCSAKGETTYTTTFKNEGFATQSKSLEDVAVDPGAHDWSGWMLDKRPTCTEKGVERRVCSHDSSHEETRDVAVDPEAHSWGEWTVVKAATEAEEGVEQRVCNNDASHVETRAIPKLGSAKPSAPAKTSIAKAKVTLSKVSYAYDGKAKKPAVKSVVLNGKKLKAGTDYAVKYANNKKLGKATVTVTGKGNYKGSAKATFKIVLGKAKLSTGGHAKSVDASWKKVPGAKGYQLQYRLAGGKWKTVTVKGASKTVKNLKANGLYQFRVCAVAGKQKGAWSTVSNRYLRSLKGVKAEAKKAGTVTAIWEADPKANAGYTVLVRYKKGGKVAAKANVAKGKAKATVKGLKADKKLWVEVRPMRKSGKLTYAGVLYGTWAKA